MALTLGGCAHWFGGQPDTTTVFKPIEIPNVQPTPMTLRPVQWRVYTVAQLRTMVAQMEASGQTEAVFYVLPREEYESLAFNLAEMARFIRDQRAANEYLVEAIEINNAAAAGTETAETETPD